MEIRKRKQQRHINDAKRSKYAFPTLFLLTVFSHATDMSAIAPKKGAAIKMEHNTPGPDRSLESTDQGLAKVVMDFIRMVLPILLLLLLTFSIIHYFHHSVTSKILRVREQSHIKFGFEAVRSDVQAATSDLLHLAASVYVLDLLRSNTPEARAKLADEFISVLKAKKHYDQIRYLDSTGMEVVRVNYNSGLPLAVPDDKLQHKGERYYFTDAVKLDRHRVFVSPMDLNIENGKIEIPLKPMLRFGTPVFDHLGQKKGVILINYYADTIRQNIKQFLVNPDSKPMLVNAQGYWLLSPDSKDEWGFMYHNERRFDRRYPDIWGNITQEKTGQISTPQGLFTFITIYPLQKMHISSSGAAKPFGHSKTMVDDQMYFWVLLTHIPRARLHAEIYSHVREGALQFFLVCIIVMPLVWFYSHERVQRRWAHRQLRNKEQYLRAITSQLAEGLLVIDRQGNVMTMNQEAEHLLGWNSQELVGSSLKTVLKRFPRQKAEANRDCKVMKAIHQSVSQHMDNIPFMTKSGNSIPVSCSVAPYRCEERVRGAIITFRDISESLRMQAELKIMATHDPLTGVKNRGEIERQLNMELNRAKRYARSLGVLMMDIDHFKAVNDTHGHQNGDAVLQHLCKTTTRQLRDSDILGRYGGEEFLVILPETGHAQAEAIAQRLRRCLAETAVVANDQKEIRFTVSIGVAAYPESAQNAETLVRVADELLYKGKKSGRNCVIAKYDPVPPPVSIAASDGQATPPIS
jgi:diguanylate cyclase (GGDEF)-like protein/PAS domain S-box-containing protein